MLRFLDQVPQLALNKWCVLALLKHSDATITQLVGSHIPSGFSGPVLVDRHGLPGYSVAVWSATVTAPLADSTNKKFRYIDNLYQHGDVFHGNRALDDALGTLDNGSLAEILQKCRPGIEHAFGIIADPATARNPSWM